MGSIFKDSKGRSPNYYLLFKTAHGWRKKSSGTSDKAKARLMLYGLIEVVAWGSLSLRALVIAVALQS
jgi:hypothetical protein